MRHASRHHAPASRLQGALATLLAVWVFALGLLTVAPEAHALLHGESASHADHNDSATHDDSGCAVSLFQQGVTTPLDLPRIGAPCECEEASVLGMIDRVLAQSPRCRPPACGPPQIG